jgi:hypothetical protein
MEKLLAIIVMSFAVSAHAQVTKPDWVQVTELVDRVVAEEDFTILANAFMRCSAFSLTMGAIITRDAGEELGNTYNELGLLQYRLSNMYDAAVRVERGVDVDIEAALEDLSKMQSPGYKLMLDNYSNRLSFNYINHGGYLEPEDIKKELVTCKQITEDYNP